MDKVRTPHEGAMLGGSSIVVPKVECDEFYGFIERLRREEALGAKFRHQIERCLDLLIGRLHHHFGLLVKPFHLGSGVTL